MIIEEKEVERTTEKLIRQAHYKDIDTGDKRVVTIFDKEGVKREEQRPIYDRKFVPVEKEIVIIKQKVFEIDDGTDVHQFATLEDAERFKSG